MTLYKIIIGNRNYASWDIVEANTLDPVSIDLNSNPIQHKLFTSDVFTFIENKVQINHSSIRIIDNINVIITINKF